MKLSFSTLGCPQWSWQDILSTAKDLGYNGIEVRGILSDIFAPKAKPFAETPEGLPRTIAALARLQLDIPCLASACDLFNPARKQANLDECRAYIHLAQKLGVPYIRVLGDLEAAPSDAVDEATLVAVAQELGNDAEAAGVMLLIESNGIYADTQQLAGLLQQIDRPAVGALWDVHHPFRFFQEFPDTSYRNLKPWLRHVHIKDSVEMDGKIIYRMLGEGDIPVKACVDALRSGGYDGYYSLEWLKRWNLTLEEPGIVFSHYIAYMKQL